MAASGAPDFFDTHLDLVMKLSPVRFFRPAALAAALVLTLGHASADAANFDFAGNLAYDTDVVKATFALTGAASNVDVWTDSWKSGLNFDPVVAVWSLGSGSVFTLIAEVDDDDTVAAGQGAFDAGLHFGNLAAGRYLITLAASPNYALGTTLSAGFTLDGSAPIRINDWTQPSSNPNFPDQKGSAWQLHVSHVDQAQVAAVPEPSTWALMLAGALGTGVLVRRRRAG